MTINTVKQKTMQYARTDVQLLFADSTYLMHVV